MYAAMGMPPEEIKRLVAAAPEATGIWPEYWPSFQVFEAMSTQWRVGFNGKTGLDYKVLPDVMTWCDIPPERQKEVFSGVRVMEVEALKYFAELAEAHGK